jgi:hypothetical protein
MPDVRLVLAGRYQTRGLLGNGAGTGVEEYLGRDLRLARPVVIQVIRGAGRDGFAPQARLMASLDHPAVASVYDWGQQDDLAYLIREYVPGKDLRTLLAERGTLPVGQAMAVGAEVAAALAAAYRVGLAHGSLDAADVILGDQRVTVVGFGAAWMREVAADQDDRPDAPEAPEAPDARDPVDPHDARDAADLEPDPRDVRRDVPRDVRRDVGRDLRGELRGDLQEDLAALGAMLRQMVTGVAPERSATVTPMASTRLTFQLRQVIARLTSSDPIDRYQGAEAVRADLLHLVRESEPVHPAVLPAFAVPGWQGRPLAAERPGDAREPVAPVEPGAPTERIAPTRPSWVSVPVAGPGDLGELHGARLDEDPDDRGHAGGSGDALEEHDHRDQAPGRRRAWVVALIAVSAAVIAGAIAVAALSLTRPDRGPHHPARNSVPPPSTRSGTTVGIGVPNVIGLDQAAAMGAMRRAGFVPNLSLRASNQLTGVVTDQSPHAGEQPPLGALVFLTVSTGPATTVGASRTTRAGPGPLTRT